MDTKGVLYLAAVVCGEREFNNSVVSYLIVLNLFDVLAGGHSLIDILYLKGWLFSR